MQTEIHTSLVKVDIFRMPIAVKKDILPTPIKEIGGAYGE